MMNFRKIILKNKNTKDKIELNSFDEFYKRFEKDLKNSITSYIDTQEKKTNYLPNIMKKNRDFISEFYFDLQFNFNSFGISDWYIERIL